jgi:hypothetical protein
VEGSGSISAFALEAEERPIMTCRKYRYAQGPCVKNIPLGTPSGTSQVIDCLCSGNNLANYAPLALICNRCASAVIWSQFAVLFIDHRVGVCIQISAVSFFLQALIIVFCSSPGGGTRPKKDHISSQHANVPTHLLPAKRRIHLGEHIQG